MKKLYLILIFALSILSLKQKQRQKDKFASITLLNGKAFTFLKCVTEDHCTTNYMSLNMTAKTNIFKHTKLILFTQETRHNSFLTKKQPTLWFA